ncbi:MAG: glutamate ABC transporter substrate-binding protein [Nocardioidaceae bacterium]|nr:glutamate ABC transporter substrate-binding protein [Nocardioidaceae bacterium]
MRGRIRFILAPIAGLLLVAGCGYDETSVPKSPAAETAAGGSSGQAPACDNATTSYAPNTDRGAALGELKDKKRLVVGVSADSYKLGSANPFKNSRIEGFDIDLAEAIAKALGVKVQLRVISAGERIDLLKNDKVDIVARNFTMNCDRWEQIGFSAVYYDAAQKVLIRKDTAGAWKKYAGPQDLAGLRVCAPAGTTSIANIQKIEPDAIAVAAANHTGCLVKFQQGEVDAITGDDTVLAGLSAQDPYTVVPDQDELTEEPYGIGVNKKNTDLIRFINSVIEKRRSNGAWQTSYNTWLKPYLGAQATPPRPEYGR